MKRFVVGIALAFAVACGSDSTAPTLASVAGNWTLQTVNGGSLPFTISQSGSTRIELLSDALSIATSGSFTETTVVRTTTGSQVSTQTVATTGIFALNGTAVTYNTNSGLSGTGSVSGSTFTLANNGLAYIYKKQ